MNCDIFEKKTDFRLEETSFVLDVVYYFEDGSDNGDKPVIYITANYACLDDIITKAAELIGCERIINVVNKIMSKQNNDVEKCSTEP